MNADFDVLVAGGGNAALCAAIEARTRGASVVVLERAPLAWRGGNSKYTRNVRFAAPDGTNGSYVPERLLSDLVDVTGPALDLELAGIVAERSRALPAWMESHGVRWQKPMRGTVQFGETNRFFLGGGKALLNTYYRRSEELGVVVRYGAFVRELETNGSGCTAALVEVDGAVERITFRSVVVATGGFEANLDWLREYWGDAVDRFSIRGTEYNDGALLRNLLDLGATSRGNPRGFHAIAVDARSPRYEAGIVSRVDSLPFSIVVNRDAVRFADEGADLWPRRYATWGSLIAEQPDQRAYSIFDSKVVHQFIHGAYPALTADSLAELANRTGLSAPALERTVAEYNAAVVDSTYAPDRLDGCATRGLTPPKSHWALRIDTPPYHCFPLVPGITFTYLGVGVDSDGRVLWDGSAGYDNVYAAGEIMAGNILTRGYLAGFGMTIGSVFGQLAGSAAATHAQNGR